MFQIPLSLVLQVHNESEFVVQKATIFSVQKNSAAENFEYIVYEVCSHQLWAVHSRML
jgi:hypothetical protein